MRNAQEHAIDLYSDALEAIDQINDTDTTLLSARSTKIDLLSYYKRLEMFHTGEIAKHRTDDKPTFTNDAARAAELRRRLDEDPDALETLSKIRECDQIIGTSEILRDTLDRRYRLAIAFLRGLDH